MGRELITSTGTHIAFLFDTVSDSGKTKIWDVVAKEDFNDYIGQVKWFGRWRCYALFPQANTVFEKTCLRDIANFCEEQTKLHKEAK